MSSVTVSHHIIHSSFIYYDGLEKCDYFLVNNHLLPSEHYKHFKGLSLCAALFLFTPQIENDARSD